MHAKVISVVAMVYQIITTERQSIMNKSNNLAAEDKFLILENSQIFLRLLNRKTIQIDDSDKHHYVI